MKEKQRKKEIKEGRKKERKKERKKKERRKKKEEGRKKKEEIIWLFVCLPICLLCLGVVVGHGFSPELPSICTLI